MNQRFAYKQIIGNKIFMSIRILYLAILLCMTRCNQEIRTKKSNPNLLSFKIISPKTNTNTDGAFENSDFLPSILYGKNGDTLKATVLNKVEIEGEYNGDFEIKNDTLILYAKAKESEPSKKLDWVTIHYIILLKGQNYKDIVFKRN